MPSLVVPSTDRIEKQIVIAAPRTRVWHALTNAEAYGEWFGADLKGQTFAVGQRVTGQVTIPGYTHVKFDVIVERIDPMVSFAYRWHPYAIDPDVDYSQEKRTLVTFTLADAADGTRLKVVESGFDDVMPERRMEAFRMNSGGWEAQMRNIGRYAAANASVPKIEGFAQDLFIAAAPAEVYSALTTLDGLRSWWTRTCDGGTDVGSRLTFRFGSTHKTMEIVTLQPGAEVLWRCVDSHIDAPGVVRRTDEWNCTAIAFHLSPQRGGTRLQFAHHGLTPEVECYEVCTQGWRQFLGSLQAYLETGTGTPYAGQPA